ncbi:MAG: hypothetical protein Q9226_001164 [Calogaya cf. arnoldii]
MAARKSLLAKFHANHVDQSRDEENVLGQITSMTLGDQDKVAVIVDHQAVKGWLLEPRFAGLMDDQLDLDAHDFANLMQLFVRLLQRSSQVTPIVCILDGISFYEAQYQRAESCKLVKELAALAGSKSSVLRLLLTSPLRTNYIVRQPEKASELVIAEVSDHVSGAKQGLNLRHVLSTTEKRAGAR